jgi:hypothetical protein
LECSQRQPVSIAEHRSTGDVRFSPDGKWLAVASNNSVWLWNFVGKTERELAFEEVKRQRP